MATRSIETDVLVVGAGPAGATIARLLAAGGRRVTMLAPSAPSVDRIEVLPPSGRGLVEMLELSSLLADPEISRPCAGIRRRWNSDEAVYDDFLWHRGGEGYLVDRTRFDACLRATAIARGVHFEQGRVTAARIDSGSLVAEGHDGEVALVIHAGLAIDATGRPAMLARRLGARRLTTDRLVADLIEISAIAHANESEWLDVRGTGRRWSYEASGPRRKERWIVDVAPGPRSADTLRVDASAMLLQPAARAGWIAIGDAACAFDPIASQGLVNVLASAREAARLILSEGGISAKSAAAYSDLVGATFHYSEAGRRAVYGAADGGNLAQFEQQSVGVA